MPKVGKQVFKFKDDHKEFDVYYSERDGFTLKGFPPVIRTTVENVDGSCGTFVTQKALVDYHRTLISRYYDIIKTERRVIIVRMNFSSNMTMNKTGHGSFSGYKKWYAGIEKNFQDFMTAHGSLDYSIGFEYETGVVLSGERDKFFWTELDEEGNVLQKSTYGDDFKEDNCIVLDYTPEAHIFLKKMGEQMEAMAIKLAHFFSNRQRLIAAINKNTNLLTNG